MFSTLKSLSRLKPRFPILSPSSIKPNPSFRRLSTPPPPPPPPSRADRIISKLPKYLHPYTRPLLSHPASHITSFLILHELTAILPLFALFTFFNLTSWNPADLLPAEWIETGYNRFKRYIEKKGLEEWIDGRGVMDLAIAWAVVKALMPVRVLGSVWAAPWFARKVVIPVVGLVKRR
ncbi:hypothetical protein TWF106_005447 [Orbilia oligospora]|uniref:Uncharacterized protein n=1 Tax=Orbilia oligospora TaxID=2813651 RepID=A0A6G1M558_ORBOL|nr:hypothetical protein TWF679_000614 [Orbilia oligospora]KAF3220168.1 hypothetical protein TWF191_007485 [Orbilia oligospora]KAF3222641.1 hypothetical protein TWF106_005447 [Orbilia oligospora]KAF3243415.1 hypothetical protein TWF192_008322 [Orbilia oligospora]